MVIDPNVFISALMAKPGSPNLAIAQAVTTNKLMLVACPAFTCSRSPKQPTRIVSGDRKLQAVDMLGIDVRPPRAMAGELNERLAMRHCEGRE